jgi:uncharacterized protein
MYAVRFLLAALALLLGTAHSASAQDLSADKRAAIERLLVQTNFASEATKTLPVIVGQLTNSLKQAHPGIPQKALDAMPEEVTAVFKENIGTFTEMMVQIYHKHFNLEDIEQISRFYDTPIGKKLIDKQSLIQTEGFIAGNEWGKLLNPEVTRRVRERLAKEGVNL